MKTKIEEATFGCDGCINYDNLTADEIYKRDCSELFKEHDVGFCDEIIFVEDNE